MRSLILILKSSKISNSLELIMNVVDLKSGVI